jgi:hypothetical protein
MCAESSSFSPLDLFIAMVPRILGGVCLRLNRYAEKAFPTFQETCMSWHAGSQRSD